MAACGIDDSGFILTQEEVKTFQRDGFLLVKGFYDIKRDIEPIWHAIHRIIGLVIKKYGLAIEQLPFSPETFDSGYMEMLAAQRSYASEVYDAVKQIPAFLRLVANYRHDLLLAQLRGTDMPGVAAAGYGIRIDNPFEERFRAPWHQDYPAQLRSMDGVVFWSPLVRMTSELGPVEFCVGSHKDGVVPVYTRDPKHPDKQGAYSLILESEEARLARYPHATPLCEPGDVVLIDFLVLHTSGFNTSTRPRWSMQMRYFNFEDPTGIMIGWKGSYASGVDFSKIHPELCLDRTAQ
jgi:hypothetical protein